MSRMHFTDADLRERWRCADSKLWRMRKGGLLHSIKVAGRGMWLTPLEEVERLESIPPDKVKPGPSVDAEGTGEIESNKPPLNSQPAASAQASSNGGAHG
jgi:hypothetical protein